MNRKKWEAIDWGITLVPLGMILLISGALLMIPEQAQRVITFLNHFFVNEFGFFYILLGLGILITAIWLAFSKYGQIKLGAIEKPRYGNFRWGSMIFTSTMAADILYWSLVEWAYYYEATPFGMEQMTLAEKQDMASAYPLFHWGPIPWAFYILPAVAYAYMIYVKKRNRQTLSEACRPILGKRTNQWQGRFIDIFAVVGLLAGTATTFSLATPLLAGAAAKVFSIKETKFLSILILLVIGVVFMAAVLWGMKAIAHLASACVILFFILAGIFFFCGPKVYLIETGVTAIGTVIQNFVHMATWMDPLRLSGDGGNGFPQTWTVFYWAYWIAWFVATPFFIARISEGRTIKQTILGGLSCGLSGTYTSFLIFGGYGLYQQTHGIIDVAGSLAAGAEPSAVILQVFDQLPITEAALIILIFAMIAFYASTFDAITLVVAGYSEKKAEKIEEPRKGLRIFWAFVFLLLPIALLFSESTLSMLQTVSIIAAFPLGLIMILIVYSFLKELKKDLTKQEKF
ncbi:MAG: BCCT family transporter [Lachnospiraceae bacterium]|nr:BCCT family transporter [Lachnospiraceae bacterium]